MAACIITALLLLGAAAADPLSLHGQRAVVLLFVRADCPISNRYAPELQRLHRAYSPQRIEFYLVYTEPGVTAAAAKKHHDEYGFSFPFLIDTDRRYVSLTKVHVTPEAAVLVDGRLVYRGRIDDRFVELGKARAEALHHDLDAVLAAISAGKTAAFRETRAVGCAIEGLP